MNTVPWRSLPPADERQAHELKRALKDKVAQAMERTCKRFVVEFESDAATRWLINDRDLAEQLAHLCRSIGEVQTQGTKPKVTVIVETDSVTLLPERKNAL